MPTEFAELCAKTNFSLLEGASRAEEMVEAAKALGLYALAVADRNGFYGSVRAHEAAKKLSTRYIVGAELSVLAGPPAARHSKEIFRSSKVIFLVENQIGYRNLCRLLTTAHAGLPREEAKLSLSNIANHCAGLFLILRVPREPDIRRGEATRDEDFELAGALRESAGERAFIATSRLSAADDRLRESWAKQASRFCDMGLVATAEPLFHHPSRKSVADVLQCIRDKTTLDRAGDRLHGNAQSFLRSASDMARLFRDAPERLGVTVDIAKACTFSLSQLEYSFPSDDALPGESPDDSLRRLVREWAPRRYPDGVPPQVAVQLEKEVALISKMKVAQFFLSVYDIVKIARDKSILCQGRGSAANSAVCYVLGITAVDPARSNLLFERFLSSERGEPPDIDVDFEHERREEVIQAIYEKYGRERAAMVSEVNCYRSKSALRETAKAFGFTLEQADKLTGMVGPYDPVDAKSARLAELGFDPSDRRIQLVMQVATELQGFPRHMSTHVGGFVLSAAPLEHVSPVEPAKMEGRTVVPWDKDDIDALGFFKVDVLGLGMLTAIRKALELVHRAKSAEEAQPRERAGGDVFDPIQALAAIPAEDSAVYDAICKADTIGVFQIESRAQMAMLPRMKPREFYDLVIEVAIVRPGPIQGGMVHPYLRRRAGQENATLPHPSLAPILRRTLGVPLFQEQVMQIAIVAGGYSAGEADELRRDMAAWRRTAKLLRHQDKLVQGFVSRGISRDFADRLFSQIKGFGEYGFPESHAASFALLVYASAWLKVHHPLEFACALINSQPMGFYSVSSIVRDAQTHGVAVLAPDVEKSSWDCAVEGPPEKRAMRLGLRLVKGMGEDVAFRIACARDEAPFRDTKDLVIRSGLRSDQADALAEAGALDSLANGRRQAMWKVRAPNEGGLFARAASNEPEVSLPRLAGVQQLRFDYAKLGLSVSDHPMGHLRTQMKKRGVVTSRELYDIRHGSTVNVAGLVLSRQRPMTASGVVFMTLEDETGMINLILTPDMFDRTYRLAVSARLVFARGKVERTPRSPKQTEHPVIHVLVDELEALELPGGLEAKSRDFR